MSEDFEELEQIPWAALAATPGDSKARNAAIAVGVAAIIVMVGWFALRGAQPTVTFTDPEPTSTTVAMAPGAVSLAADSSTTVAAVPDPIPVFSEADLMLIDVEQEQMLAVMQAEWLVRDYLTVDGDSLVLERMEALLLPDPPVAGAAASYVEWVRAFSVSSPEPGHYRVEVLYRILAGADEGFVRQPADALAVEIAIDVDGSARLLAAPEPVSVPALNAIEQ